MSLVSNSPIFGNLLETASLSFLDDARVLICGGTGLVGGYLTATFARGCAQQGIKLHQPITVTGGRKDHYLQKLVSEGLVEIVPLEILLDRKFSKEFTHTFHAASPASPNNYSNGEVLNYLNIKILPRLIELTSKLFLFFSTGEVYGTTAPFGVDEEFHGPLTESESRLPYPLAKVTGEQILREMAHFSDFPIKVARLFHTFGPGISERDPRTFSSFLYQGHNEGQIILRSSGDQIRSFLHLADAVRGVIALSSQSKEEVFDITNIGSTLPTSIKEFASLVAILTESKITFDSRTQFELSPNEVMVPNTNRLRTLGWEQSISLSEAINDTLAWLRLPKRGRDF